MENRSMMFVLLFMFIADVDSLTRCSNVLCIKFELRHWDKNLFYESKSGDKTVASLQTSKQVRLLESILDE